MRERKGRRGKRDHKEEGRGKRTKKRERLPRQEELSVPCCNFQLLIFYILLYPPVSPHMLAREVPCK